MRRCFSPLPTLSRRGTTGTSIVRVPACHTFSFQSHQVLDGAHASSYFGSLYLFVQISSGIKGHRQKRATGLEYSRGSQGKKGTPGATRRWRQVCFSMRCFCPAPYGVRLGGLRGKVSFVVDVVFPTLFISLLYFGSTAD